MVSFMVGNGRNIPVLEGYPGRLKFFAVTSPNLFPLSNRKETMVMDCRRWEWQTSDLISEKASMAGSSINGKPFVGK